MNLDRNLIDDGMLWLMLLSIGAICILLCYYGAVGMSHISALHDTPAKQLFAFAGYLLFFIIPLMIIALTLESTYINRLLEWSTAFLVVSVVVDIILLTLISLAMLLFHVA